MEVALSLNLHCDEDWFFRGLVVRSGVDSPDAYVAELVRAHVRSHADVRVCPNGACGLPVFPSPEYPSKRKQGEKPTWKRPCFCSRCGTKLEA